jgi:hypothetical protein
LFNSTVAARTQNQQRLNPSGPPPARGASGGRL